MIKNILCAAFVALMLGCSKEKVDQQMIVSVPQGSIEGVMLCMQDGRVVRQIPVTVGKNSVIAAQKKREGDGCTPCGTYPIRRGMWREADLDTEFDMQLITPRMIWIDDAEMSQYNTLVEDDGTSLSGHGERLIDYEVCYRYLLVVEYNTSPVRPGLGSAIFIHAWKKPGTATHGCVAMSMEQMQWLVEWVRPDSDLRITIEPSFEEQDC